MKIAFMGTPDFSVSVLKALMAAGHEICGVVTQPDRPRGRRRELMPSPVKETALTIGCPILQPEKIREEGAVAEVLALEADMIVVAAFGQIIPKAILEAPRYGCINVHASLLPAYRGASPIQSVILDGCRETGVTIMKMDAGLDTGDIISQCVVPIEDDDTGGSLFDKLAAAGSDLLVRTIPAIESGEAVYTAQPEISPTAVTRQLAKSAGLIDWQDSAEALERRIRAMNPWPCAYAVLDGHTIKIWKAHVEKPDMSGDAGLILRQDRNGIYVQTGRGVLCLDEVQMEGRRRLPTAEFIRGYVIRRNHFE